MKKIITILTLLTATSFSFAKDCSFRKVDLTKREGTTGIYKISDKITLELLEEVEGPVWVVLNGTRKCKIDGGNFSGFYLSDSKKYVMTSEYSGSCGENRIFDINTCKIHSVKADYCGSAEVVGSKVINKPACEPTEKGKAFCSSAKVYTITGADCILKLDEKASKALTKKELGVELPFDKEMTVTYPRK